MNNPLIALQPKGTSSFQLQACDEGASSLLIRHRDSCYLFDCWLEPSYYALHNHFYHGARVNPVWIGTDDLPPLDGLFLSSAQNDHSDLVSLKKLILRYPGLKVWADSSIAGKVQKLGCFRIHQTKSGEAITIDDKLKIIQLKGYGGCFPYLYHDLTSRQSLCIAPHSIHLPWLIANLDKLKQQLQLGQEDKLITTLCLGITPTVLNPLGRLHVLMPDRGINIPLPQQNLNLINLLQPETIITIHQTTELRTGWATRNLVQFPWMNEAETKNQINDTGTLAAQQWLAQRYKEGTLMNPNKELLEC